MGFYSIWFFFKLTASLDVTGQDIPFIAHGHTGGLLQFSHCSLAIHQQMDYWGIWPLCTT